MPLRSTYISKSKRGNGTARGKHRKTSAKRSHLVQTARERNRTLNGKPRKTSAKRSHLVQTARERNGTLNGQPRKTSAKRSYLVQTAWEQNRTLNQKARAQLAKPRLSVDWEKREPEGMSWRFKLTRWENGFTFSYPSRLKNTRFMYETSFCDAGAYNAYREEFIPSPDLQSIRRQDYSPFATHLTNNSDPNVTSFLNLSGDTLLVIPVPVPGKNYTTIKDFTDNAPRPQQVAFWQRAAHEIRNWLSTRGKVYVSTHGLGVAYFHLRLCGQPKYYHTAEFF